MRGVWNKKSGSTVRGLGGAGMHGGVSCSSMAHGKLMSGTMRCRSESQLSGVLIAPWTEVLMGVRSGKKIGDLTVGRSEMFAQPGSREVITKGTGAGAHKDGSQAALKGGFR